MSSEVKWSKGEPGEVGLYWIIDENGDTEIVEVHKLDSTATREKKLVYYRIGSDIMKPIDLIVKYCPAVPPK